MSFNKHILFFCPNCLFLQYIYFLFQTLKLIFQGLQHIFQSLKLMFQTLQQHFFQCKDIKKFFTYVLLSHQKPEVKGDSLEEAVVTTHDTETLEE